MSTPESNTRFSLPATTGRPLTRWLACAIACLACGTALAALPLKTIEECIESGTREVSLPGIASGSLSTAPCSGCPALRLSFDANTLYLIGKQTVTYAKFREAAAKDDQRLDVFYEPKSRMLTRLRLPAAAGSQ